MRILWVATKTPEPPIDGGRLVQKLTIEALRREGAEVVVVAPEESMESRGWSGRGHSGTFSLPSPGTALAALRRPLTIARHESRRVGRRVRAALADTKFDVVHAEQLQALAQAAPGAAEQRVPVLLRAQNVESDLWWRASERLRWLSPLLRWEARRLRHFEAAAVADVPVTVALTAYDATQLRRLAAELHGRSGRVVEIAAPFPKELPPGLRLEGAPAIVLVGSGDWYPNRESRSGFVTSLWPQIRARLPGARLHVFASPAERESDLRLPAGVSRRTLEDSKDAYGEGAIQVVPLRVASGVRIKILEGWARGVPSVSTPIGARGLGAVVDKDVLVGTTSAELIEHIVALSRDHSLYGRLVANGRALLEQRHDPALVARQLLAQYEALATRGVRAN